MEKLTDRAALQESFLEEFFQGNSFSLQPVTGDAGLRDYYRVISQGESFVLMDCPPSYADIDPFIKIANYINSIGLVAPQIHSSDQQNGFILLQDFGNQSAGDLVNDMSTDRQKLDFYKLTIDILYHLQQHTPPAYLPKYTNDLLLSELDLYIKWYVPHANGGDLANSAVQEFYNLWQSILKERPQFTDSMVLRDYHVQNMMVLDKNNATTPGSLASLGLLDFQDALIGSPIYDIVSILEDARIKVERSLATKVLEYFAAKAGLSYQDIMLEYSILGAQRNMRILGVFARKAIRDNTTSYLNFIPNVLKYIEYDLSHPFLSKLKDWTQENIKQTVYESL